MSAPYYCGELDFNKPLDDAAKGIITAIFGEPDKWRMEVYEEHIEFMEYYEYDMDELLEEFQNQMAALGYTVDGSLSFYGDCDDGRIDVDTNGVETIYKEDFSLHNATDEELIRILEDRGYTVTKN